MGDTVEKLLESGDQVLKIVGCPSGTLGYVFGELGRGTAFSAALRAAMSLGWLGVLSVLGLIVTVRCLRVC